MVKRRARVQYGHEVHTATGENVKPDDKLMEYAYDNGCILVIEDTKASRMAVRMGVLVLRVNMELIARGVHRQLTAKYPGILEPYADELFSKKNGGSINIPVAKMASLIEGQKGGPLEVTRRAKSLHGERF